jgi:hypothetical protein
MFHFEMPGVSKRQAHSRLAIFERWPKENVLSECEGSSEDDSKMNVDFKTDSDADLLELYQQKSNLKKYSFIIIYEITIF